MGYSPRGCKELDTTERAHKHMYTWPEFGAVGPNLQLCEVVAFNKSSCKEKKKLEPHMVNSGSRA